MRLINAVRVRPRVSPVCLLFVLLLPATAAAETAPVRLVLQITVDGLRADLIERYADRFGDGGFRRLEQSGTLYANAYYQHANTETIVGHSTLATGTHPSSHGMTGNVWYDADSGELAYNVEDPEYPLLPSRAEAMEGDQVDPAQQLARTNGRSPRALRAETFSDRLVATSGGQARVFAISGKDRGAIPMAGKSGKAFWMSTDSGDFVTSSYYYDKYPGWLAGWNAARKPDRFAGDFWTLRDRRNTYVMAELDDRPYESDLRGFGRTFPHLFGAPGDKLLYTQILASPHGDALLADLAEVLIASESLGADDQVDYLSVSFSGVDAVNHFFGPSSLEAEDMVLRFDDTLADLLDFVDREIGLEHVLVVLSADHGAPEAPEYMAGLGHDAARLNTADVLELAREAAADLYGSADLVRFYYRPFVYLDEERIDELGLDHEVVAKRIAVALNRHPGVNLAIAIEDAIRPDTTELRQRVRNSVYEPRAGDIYLVQEPYWFNFDRGPISVAHGSPWRYDTHVPVLFAGPGIPVQRVAREIQPADVAPTLSAMLGLTAPASANGAVLSEVVSNSRARD